MTRAARASSRAHAEGEASGYKKDLAEVLPEPRSSQELQAIAVASQQLVVALRFGNRKYDKGNKQGMDNAIAGMHQKTADIVFRTSLNQVPKFFVL